MIDTGVVALAMIVGLGMNTLRLQCAIIMPTPATDCGDQNAFEVSMD